MCFFYSHVEFCFWQTSLFVCVLISEVVGDEPISVWFAFLSGILVDSKK